LCLHHGCPSWNVGILCGYPMKKRDIKLQTRTWDWNRFPMNIKWH
jgi:hypothetical protein